MNTSELLLIALIIVFTIPYLIWRIFRTEYYAPLVVVQILTGILFGPGVLGAAFPDYYRLVFNSAVMQSLTGIAWWAVMLFVWLAGIELDLRMAWKHRHESAITAGLALGTPLLMGCLVAYGMLMFDGWSNSSAKPWQFILGIGMSCAVTALPILILFLEKLDILRSPLGQRILRYASLDDIAIWSVLALILLDWERIGKQLGFIAGLALIAPGLHWLIKRLPERDRWHIALIWLAICSFWADWSGLHFMVGAFLSGAVLDKSSFNQVQMDQLRNHVLFILMPVFFLSTGLRTNWSVDNFSVFLAAGALLLASVIGKLAGTLLAGKILKWGEGEIWLIGWLLQTKALIMIIFAGVLLDKQIISNNTFTALLLMAIASTMLTIPIVNPMLREMKTSLPHTK